MDIFTITVADNWITRLPERLAVDLGFFAENGLEVRTLHPEPWNKVLADLNLGKACCAADGLWLPSLYKGRGADYFAFAKAASRFPMTLVSRVATEAFQWEELEGKVVLIPGSNDAGPRMYTLGCAREGGADIGRIKYVPNFYAPMLFECFAGGWGDYIVLRTDQARAMVRDHGAHIVHDFSNASIPWMVYYTTPEYLVDHHAEAGRFVAGLEKGRRWLGENGAEACRKTLAKHWPDLPQDETVSLIDEYLRTGMWEGTEIGTSETARWQGFLHESLLLDAPLGYGEIIDGRPLAHAREIEK